MWLGVKVNRTGRPRRVGQQSAKTLPTRGALQTAVSLPRPELRNLQTLRPYQPKTHLTDSQFSTLDLSAGQRKRLALIVALLEKRPLLLLDEWAADQDPEFRRKFYYDLLPELKQSGETVVAITHDDRYIDEMDFPARRLRMEDGRFAAQETVENR
jgi:putative ATP-binding cassette transporter